MEYRCEDLPQHGIVLVPPSSPDYVALLGDIERRSQRRAPGSPPPIDFEDPAAPTMILRNRSQLGIEGLAWCWSFEPETGRSTGARVSRIGGAPSVLAPFGLDDRTRTLYGYWHTIFPGSNRAIRGGSLLGDNTDVRPPRGDEIWKGGAFGGGGGSRLPVGPLKRVTLSLDGVFFLDGGFAGPDTLHNFERFVADVDAHLEVAAAARDGHNRGLAPAAIFERIEALTGPASNSPPPPPPGSGIPDPAAIRQASLQNLAFHIAAMRTASTWSDDRVIFTFMSWAETPLPNFRKI